MRKRYVFITLISFTSFFTSCKDKKETGAITLCKEYLQKNLQDPESLKIYEVKASSKDEHGVSWEVFLDYGAKNGFGGMNRNTVSFQIIGDAITRVDGKFIYYKKGDK